MRPKFGIAWLSSLPLRKVIYGWVTVHTYHVTIRGKVYAVKAWGPRDALSFALSLYTMEPRARAGRLKAVVRREGGHSVVLYVRLARAVDPKDQIQKWDFEWE